MAMPSARHRSRRRPVASWWTAKLPVDPAAFGNSRGRVPEPFGAHRITFDVRRRVERPSGRLNTIDEAVRDHVQAPCRLSAAA